MHDVNKMQNKDKNPTTKEITYRISGKGKSWSYGYGKLHSGRYTGPGKYFPAELPGAAGKDVAEDTEPATGRLAPAERQALAVETAAPMTKEMPLVLAVEPQAPAWAQHTVQFLQTGELPKEQEEAEKVALSVCLVPVRR